MSDPGFSNSTVAVSVDEIRARAVDTVRALYDAILDDPRMMPGAAAAHRQSSEVVAAMLQSATTLYEAFLDAALESGYCVELPALADQLFEPLHLERRNVRALERRNSRT